MDDLFVTELKTNSRRFQHTLERIYEKYSVLDDKDQIEVDLDKTHIETLEHYMTQSEKSLKFKSIAGFREEPSMLMDITKTSELEFTYQARDVDGSLDSIWLNKDEVTQNNTTCFSVNSLDESQRNVTYQPEDQDEQLEMSLQSQGNSLGDLYPDMINKIRKACHREHVSEAADSVRRRYRKWRHLSRSGTSLTNSFHTSPGYTSDKNTTRAIFNKKNIQSPAKTFTMTRTVTEAASQSPVKTVKDVLVQKTQHQYSPVRARAPQRREAPAVVVMDMSFTSSQPEKTLNKTFIVSELTSPQKFQLDENPSLYTASPSKAFYPTTETSQELYFRMKESCRSPHGVQAADCSVHSSEESLLKEMPDVYGSPVRRSPYKAQLTSWDSYKKRDINGSPVRPRPYKSQTHRESLGQSPLAFVESPKSPYVHSYPREPKRQNLFMASLPSPKINIIQKTLERPAHRPSSQQQMLSPQLATSARRQHGMRRHLSFDSSLPSSRPSEAAKGLDERFLQLYHKFVCMNKSFLKGHPCHLCAKSSDASRGHPFSNLEALALSPHRSVLRRRNADFDSYPQSKRFKDCSYSPGSSRYKTMRRCLSPSAGAF